MFNSIFSQILGNLGGTATGAGQGANPFEMLSGLVGGPASESGTLFSLPNELLTGVADLGTSENILGDVMGLTKPIENLAFGGAEGLGNLVGLNPFAPGPMSEILRILGPLGLVAGASHLAAGHRRKLYGDKE